MCPKLKCCQKLKLKAFYNRVAMQCGQSSSSSSSSSDHQQQHYHHHHHHIIIISLLAGGLRCFCRGVCNRRRILDARENRSRASDKARVHANYVFSGFFGDKNTLKLPESRLHHHHHHHHHHQSNVFCKILVEGECPLFERVVFKTDDINCIFGLISLFWASFDMTVATCQFVVQYR